MTTGLLTWVPLTIAALVTFCFTFRVIRFAHQRDVLDHPDGVRKLHGNPVALLGGLGVFVGFTVGIIAMMPALAGLRIPGVVDVLPQEENTKVLLHTLGIVIGGALTFTLGLFDDLYKMRASSKALAQLAICIGLVFFGVTWDHITNFFGPAPLEHYPALRLLFSHELGGLLFFHPGLNIAITLLWLMGCMNAINLSDGLDGLASGTTLIAGSAFLFIATTRGEHAASLLAAAMCGASLGFLPHNFPKARIFLGDAGAQLFGFLLGAIAILGAYKTAAGLTLAIPFLILGVPVFDTTWAMIRRALAGQPMGAPDHNHLHHQLLRRGMTPNQATVTLWLATACLAGAAVLVARV